MKRASQGKIRQVSKRLATHPRLYKHNKFQKKGEMSGYIEEVIDDDELKNQQQLEDEASEGEDQEGGHENEGAAEPSSSATVSKGKKSKKKKKAKGNKDANDIPQAVVDHVVSEIRQKHGSSTTESLDEAHVRMALDKLRIMDVLKGKSGIGGKNRKEMGEHKFWATQPVPQLGEGVPEEDGPIEPSKPAAEVRQTPYPLPSDFEWSIVDVTDESELKELHELLSGHYVEDDDASFRFNYSSQFLLWALKPPGWYKDWHVGVRVAGKKKDANSKGRLVAFISAVPVQLRVRSNMMSASEVNFLCVHKKLRSKRLAPVLIKEITRQCHLKGIFQAIYTGGVVLPTPISTCRYYHRSLNVPKLVEIRFTSVPRNSTMARMIRQFALPSTPRLMNAEQSALFTGSNEGKGKSSTALSVVGGLREMEDRDVPKVQGLWHRYMQRFGIVPVMSEDDIRHQLLSGRGEGPIKKGRRDGQVVWSYVFEDPVTLEITDYVSFYTLPSAIMQANSKYTTLDAAYLFYYATDVVFKPDGESRLKKRLEELVTDAMIIAAQAKFDVFNALTLMDNGLFLPELKFGSGDGLLNYYLYNWRTTPLAGLEAIGDVAMGRGVGVVML